MNNVYNNHRNHIRGGLPYETGGDARGEFWIKPQKETNLGVAQPFWPLKEIILNLKKVKRIENTQLVYISSRATLKENFTAEYNGLNRAQ